MQKALIPVTPDKTEDKRTGLPASTRRFESSSSVEFGVEADERHQTQQHRIQSHFWQAKSNVVKRRLTLALNV